MTWGLHGAAAASRLEKVRTSTNMLAKQQEDQIYERVLKGEKETSKNDFQLNDLSRQCCH